MDNGVATPDTRETGPVVPVSASGKTRIASLDFIRGIAVMGILAANIVAFGQPMTAYMWPDGFLVPAGDPDDVMWAIQFVLVDGKMRGLFTLLFGAGMYLFMEKAWAKGAGRGLQARRLFWLLLFGAVHFFLIWQGDILVSYALAGFIALGCLKWRAKTQLIIGILGYISGAILALPAMAGPYLASETQFAEAMGGSETIEMLEEGKQAEIDDAMEEAALIQSGDYGGYVSHVAAQHSSNLAFYLFLAFTETIPLMLIGMALYRRGLFDGGIARGRLLTWGWIGVIAGSALTVLIAFWTIETGMTYYGTLAGFMGFSPLPRLPVIVGLAALLTAYLTAAGHFLGDRITAAGRAAFTNYLGTSIVLLPVFHGWGLGLFGELDRPQLYLVMLAVWVLILLWSKPWLERFRYGPLEWLWRCLTYGKLFPIRR